MTRRTLGARLARGGAAIALSLGVAAGSGCVTKPGWMKPAPTRSWPRTLEDVKVAAATGQYDEADKRLASFALAYPNTPEAMESVFWRALFRLDPSNPAASAKEAGETFDAYLASPAPRSHEFDARVLRRTAAQLELRSKATTVARTEGETRDKDRDEELQRTKDELARTVAELERIKRRLAAPKP